MNQTYYRCHYTSEYLQLQNVHRYLFRKLNNEIELRSNTQFKRGDIIKIVDIDYRNNVIYIEVVKDAPKSNYPILMLISTTIPFSEGLIPIIISSDTHEIIYSTRTSYNNNQFYNCAIAISKIPETIRVDYTYEASDEIAYSAEWVIRKERVK